MKKFQAILLVFVMGVSMFAGAALGEAAAPARKIIIDTDTGADDASALILAAKSPAVEILGVTVLAGNVSLEQGSKNALSALEAAGCEAPVFRGSDTNYLGEVIEPFSVFGDDGMGDKGLVSPRKVPEEKDAIDFILETVKQYPGEVEIVALGPATNIAKAIDRDPETMKQVKKIWSMATAGLGAGNATPVAEFNAYMDAPAYKRLMDSGLPVTVLGLDMCQGDALWGKEEFDTLSAAAGLPAFVADSFTVFRRDFTEGGFDGLVNNCDAVAMMCVVQEDFVTDTISCQGSCIIDSGEAYGQVIYYLENVGYDMVEKELAYATTLVSGIRAGEFFERYLAAVSAE